MEPRFAIAIEALRSIQISAGVQSGSRFREIYAIAKKALDVLDGTTMREYMELEDAE